MMRIAMAASELPSTSKNGAGYQAHYMANAFSRRKHEVTMFSPAPKPEGALYEMRFVPVGAFLRTFRFAWNLARADYYGFDVFHAHGDDYWLWGGGRTRRPVHVRTMHGSCFAEAFHVPRAKEKLRMALLGLSEVLSTAVADRTVCVSSNTCRFYPWIRRVIPNGVDLTAFHPGEKEPGPTLLFVGTYQNRKRGKWLLDIFRHEVRPRLPGARLWMVCSDVPPHEVTEGVEVLGRLTLDELADRYRRAWVFCLPSTYEGFGVPYIEAMASGTAVVTTRNPGAVEVLEDGRWGRLVDDAELGGSLAAVLQDPAAREGLEACGQERAARYGWDVVAGEYEMIYRELLESAAATVTA